MQGFAIRMRCLVTFLCGDGSKLQEKGAFSTSRDFLIFSTLCCRPLLFFAFTSSFIASLLKDESSHRLLLFLCI